MARISRRDSFATLRCRPRRAAPRPWPPELCVGASWLLGRVALTEDGQIDVAVLVDDQFLDFRQDLLHGFQIQAMAGDLRGLAVFGGDLVETRGVAGGFVDLGELVGFGLLEQLLRLAA